MEKLIEAVETAKRFDVPRKALPRVQSLVDRAFDLLNDLALEPEHDVA
jgi:hypothetical protein